MVTDYDCWKEDEEHVTLEMILHNLHRNAEIAKQNRCPRYFADSRQA